MRRFAVGFVLAIVLGLGFVSLAQAQEPDIQIVELDCNSEPELVVIQNLGNTAQDLTGWQLQSDQGDETFDLLGVLQPGEVTSIELAQQSLFRDDDPSDFARIVDDTGAIVHQVNCGEEATPAPVPSPSPTPAATPEPSPEPSPNGMPDGGGPPPPSGDPSSLALLVPLLGGSVAAVGLTALAFSRLRAFGLALPGHAARAVPWQRAEGHRPDIREGPRGRTYPLASGLALTAIAVVMAVLLLSQLRRG